MENLTIKIKPGLVATGYGVAGVMEGCHVCLYVWCKTVALVGQKDCFV